MIECNPKVIIDLNHIKLIESLIMCLKPRLILELGIGSGSVTLAISDALACNQTDFAKITCVDNFLDWGGRVPEEVQKLPVTLIIKREKEFIETCDQKYDFIVSDADHDHSHEWAERTLGLLNPKGIIVFHDICNPDYPNLTEIVQVVDRLKYPRVIFDRSSREDERCSRGLLVVFKPQLTENTI